MIDITADSQRYFLMYDVQQRWPWFVLLISAMALTPRAGAQDQTDGPGSSAPNIQGAITFLYVDELDPAAAFYGDLLELKPTMTSDWVRIFEITPGASVGLVQGEQGYHQPAADKPVMLSVVTSDVDAWYARLLKANTPILKALPPKDARQVEDSAPIRGFIARDPGGYTVEFFSWQSESEQ